LHGVESIVGGTRETFATELWSTPDAPLKKEARPDDDWVMEEYEELELKWQNYYDEQRKYSTEL
jgi:hypothetical protein